jgi:hypothetical protein
MLYRFRTCPSPHWTGLLAGQLAGFGSTAVTWADAHRPRHRHRRRARSLRYHLCRGNASFRPTTGRLDAFDNEVGLATFASSVLRQRRDHRSPAEF